MKCTWETNNWVDLAVGKLAGADTTVWLTVLSEAVVLSGLVVRHVCGFVCLMD